ncbi:hypothetical protein CLOM_g19455 [Closterium sp. NIES-68]|nr:hypothetical protein CLOM_g19455 [Closterium sp. NIES-68]
MACPRLSFTILASALLILLLSLSTFATAISTSNSLQTSRRFLRETQLQPIHARLRGNRRQLQESSYDYGDWTSDWSSDSGDSSDWSNDLSSDWGGDTWDSGDSGSWQWDYGSSDGGTWDDGSDGSGSWDYGSSDGGGTTWDDGSSGGGTDGSTDGGSTDGGSTDGGSADGGSTDGGSSDGGSSGGGGSGGTVDADVMLGEHNYARAYLSLPALTWDANLASSAQAWADNLAGRGCPLEHGGHDNMGQNLYWKSPAAFTPDEDRGAVASWNEEKQYWTYSPIPGGCAEGQQCLHYTQVVWEGTQNVGCAASKCSDGAGMWVCHYYPQGNWEGEYPYKT